MKKEVKTVNKKVPLAVLITLMLLTVVGTQLVAEASACKSGWHDRTTVIYGVTPAGNGYKEILGNLSGTDYLIRFPDPIDRWNGMLVVFCHAWNLGLEPDVSTFRTYANARIDQGYAFAASTFGEGGYPIRKAVIRTQQLTQYVVHKYNVEGKIFLVGISMGGNVALQLGAKYPKLYSGVLDVCGSKNLTASYEMGSWVSLDDAALTAELEALGPPVAGVPFSIRYYPCTSLQNLRDFVGNRSEDIADECRGTPQERPCAYKRISPVYSATNLKIPVITIHGTLDGIVPLSQTLAYQAAVAEAGHSDLYRLVIVNGGGHFNPTVQAQARQQLLELTAWSDTLDPP